MKNSFKKPQINEEKYNGLRTFSVVITYTLLIIALIYNKLSTKSLKNDDIRKFEKESEKMNH